MKVPKINWVPFDNKNLPTDLNENADYLVLLREEDYNDRGWRYSVDVGNPYGNYIDGFWDTVNDWYEGQRVEVMAYVEFPYYLKESDLFEITRQIE